VRFLVDAQLPPVLAEILRGHDHIAEHVTDVGPGNMSDRSLWRYALVHDAAIVTKDEDFSVMSTVTESGPPIVWIRVGNTRRAALLAWFEPLIPQITSALESGDRVIELR